MYISFTSPLRGSMQQQTKQQTTTFPRILPQNRSISAGFERILAKFAAKNAQRAGKRGKYPKNRR